ncbi:MAG: HNH endonuclease [candidate division KSB1 bacterium]|nr:HNH endonuclease [candidate division KSB1 bacterium]MDZ7367751.1 HNH endonuclease [candidate division KSB1 bacterium]MDZ7406284.1 HNH endonuclease [candidate division KSB1 bacterium]
MFAAARGRCAFCRSEERLMGVTFEIDHIVPRLQRGKTLIDNLCLCCPSCNRHKSVRAQAVDPTTGAETPLFHPTHDHWPEHFAWSDDGARILGLTPTGRATIEALKMNRSQMLELRRYWLANGNHPRNVEE